MKHIYIYICDIINKNDIINNNFGSNINIAYHNAIRDPNIIKMNTGVNKYYSDIKKMGHN